MRLDERFDRLMSRKRAPHPISAADAGSGTELTGVPVTVKFMTAKMPFVDPHEFAPRNSLAGA